jgi:probable phosphomutase (TIGR03848 family)
MTTVLLIRHGENSMVGKRLAGRLPGVHLNDNGKKQAEELAQVLCTAPIKAIYSSPLERVVETAEPLAQALGLEIHPAPGLIELDYGDWQGKTLKQLSRLKLWKVVQEQPSQMRFPNGESFPEVQQRAVAEVERIAAAHGEQDMVACFSHGDIIRLLAAHFLGVPLDLFQRVAANTASITVVHIDKQGRPHVAHMNQVLRLEFKQDKPDPAGGRTQVPADTDVDAESAADVPAPEDPRVAEAAQTPAPTALQRLGEMIGGKKGRRKRNE